MKLRRTISLTVFLSFIMLSFTGLMLFITPQGRVAYWAGWTMFGLSKEQYSELHTTFMVLFLVTGIWHIVLNWKPIINYMKNKSRQTKIFVPEFNLALILTALFFVGTLFSVAPFGTLVDAGTGIKNMWERHEGSPPWGHAEQSSLARFIRGLEDWVRLEHQQLVSIPTRDAIDTLRAAGLQVIDENQTVLDIAKANGTTPQYLMEVIRRAERPADSGMYAIQIQGATSTAFPLPMSGLGRMTFAQYSERYAISLDTIIERFSGHGITLDAQASIKTEADRIGTDPEGLIELLNTQRQL